MEKLDVLYSSNAAYIDIMMVSILSLIRNSALKKINIHIITYDFKREDYDKIRQIIGKYPNVTVDFYALENYDIDKYQIPSWHGLQVANARLFFQDILGDRIEGMDSLLYLDGDTIVKGDLSGLQDYSSNSISACKDNITIALTKKFGVDTYYNSGVLLINVDKWVSNHLQEKLIEEANHPSVDLYLPDQNLLNVALKDDLSELPINYNLMALEYFFSEKDRKIYFNEKIRLRTAAEVGDAIVDPKIYHCCCLAGIKPWYKNDINPFNEDFLKIAYEINPNFTRKELNFFNHFFNNHPWLYRKLLILRNYLPNEFNVFASKLSMVLQGSRQIKTK